MAVYLLLRQAYIALVILRKEPSCISKSNLFFVAWLHTAQPIAPIDSKSKAVIEAHRNYQQSPCMCN